MIVTLSFESIVGLSVAALFIGCWGILRVVSMIRSAAARRRRKMLEKHCEKCMCRIMARQQFRNGDLD